MHKYPDYNSMQTPLGAIFSRSFGHSLLLLSITTSFLQFAGLIPYSKCQKFQFTRKNLKLLHKLRKLNYVQHSATEIAVEEAFRDCTNQIKTSISKTSNCPVQNYCLQLYYIGVSETKGKSEEALSLHKFRSLKTDFG